MVARRIQLAACLWALVAATAQAQGAKLLFFPVGAPAGIKVVPPTKFNGTTPVYWNPPNGQWVIPRYANGATHPAGQLIGWGPTSVVQGTTATSSATPPAVVVTEGYLDVNKAQWQGHADRSGSVFAVANSTPIKITTSDDPPVAHGIVNGGSVTIAGTSVGAANGTFTVTTVGLGANEFTLNGTTAGGSAGAGGTWNWNVSEAVLQPVVRDLTIVGRDSGNDDYQAGGLVGDSPGLGTLRGTSITGVSNATPIVVTTQTAHGLSNGQVVKVYRVLGNTAANGIWAVANFGGSGTTFELVGSAGNGTYVAGSGQVYSTGSSSASGTISTASDTAPIRITTSAPHGLSDA